MTTALGWDRIANCQAAFAVSTSPSHQPATSGSSVLMTWGRFRKFRNWYHLISPNPRPGPFSSTHPQMQVQTKYQPQKSCCCRSALSSSSSLSSASSTGAKGGSGKSWIGHTKVFRVPFFPYIVVSPCVWWQMFLVLLVLNGKKSLKKQYAGRCLYFPDVCSMLIVHMLSVLPTLHSGLGLLAMGNCSSTRQVLSCFP